MGDQHQCRATLFRRPTEEVEHLRLNGHVEGGGWLVGNDQLRFAGERHGDHRALAHAARELMRVLLHSLWRLCDLYKLEVFNRLLVRLAPASASMRHQHFGDLLANGGDGVKGGEWLLEDHGDAATTNLAHVGLRLAEKLFAVEEDRSSDDRLILDKEADGCECRDALP